MCIDLWCPFISNMCFLVPNDNLEHGLRLLKIDDDNVHIGVTFIVGSVFYYDLYGDWYATTEYKRRLHNYPRG